MMAEFQLSIKNFLEATDSTDCLVEAQLYGRIQGDTPALLSPFTPLDGGTQLRLASGNRSVNLYFAPLHGEAPHTLRIRASVGGVFVERGDDRTVWVEAPKPHTQELRNPGLYVANLDNSWAQDAAVEWHWILEVLDRNHTAVPLNKVLFADLDAVAGSWVSKPLYLSPMLMEVLAVEPYYYGLDRSGWFPRWKVMSGLPPGWSLQYAFGSGEQVSYTWRDTLPSREEILRNGWTSLRLKVNTAPSEDGLLALTELRVRYVEEYASSNPTLSVRDFSTNLYVPKLQVTLDGVYDLTPYLVSLQRDSLQLAVPDDRFEETLFHAPLLKATLDGNPALYARVSGVRKEEYATGIAYSLSLTPLVDLLADKLDSDIIGADFDASGGPDLLFSDDGQYIAFVCQHAPGVGVLPWLLEPASFRPVETWLQNADPKLVRLDSDYDWYQLYATTNKNLRGKLKDVANANLFEFTSVAGHPALVPLVPQADRPLSEVRATVYNLTPNGLYLPEARLYVPQYSYDPSQVPKALSVQGLPTTEDSIDPSVPVAVYYRSDSGVKQDFVVEAAWQSFSVDFQFTDAQGNAAVYAPGSVETVYRDLRTVDLNPFGDPSYRIELLTSGLRLPDGRVIDQVNGYRGVLGVRIHVNSPGAWTTFTFRFRGKLLYAASGERGEDSKKRAEGRYLPPWLTGAVNEMSTLAAQLPKDEEVVENPFVTDYWLDNPALAGQVKTDPSGERYYELAGYRLYERHAARLADALALRRVLGLMTIDLRYVGHPGLKVGDFVGIARRPEGGVGRPVEAVDYFLVLEDFQVSVQAGGAVITSMRCGYVGTLKGSALERDYTRLRWRTLSAPLEEVFYF
jgi:hypothetical protein